MSDKMQFVHSIDTLVPFMPIRKADIKRILRLQLDALVEQGVCYDSDCDLIILKLR